MQTKENIFGLFVFVKRENRTYKAIAKTKGKRKRKDKGKYFWVFAFYQEQRKERKKEQMDIQSIIEYTGI